MHHHIVAHIIYEKLFVFSLYIYVSSVMRCSCPTLCTPGSQITSPGAQNNACVYPEAAVTIFKNLWYYKVMYGHNMMHVLHTYILKTIMILKFTPRVHITIEHSLYFCEGIRLSIDRFFGTPPTLHNEISGFGLIQGNIYKGRVMTYNVE